MGEGGRPGNFIYLFRCVSHRLSTSRRLTSGGILEILESSPEFTVLVYNCGPADFGIFSALMTKWY